VHVRRGDTYEEQTKSEAFPGLDLSLVLSLLDRDTVTAARRELVERLREP